MKRPSLTMLLSPALIAAGIALLIGSTSSLAYADVSASSTASVSYAARPDPNAIRTDSMKITWQNL